MDAAERYRPGVNARGEDTRQRILKAALEMFGSQGYEGVTTRALAERANVNLPAIQYYFGSKEGLYRSVVSEIADQGEERTAPVTTRIQQLLSKPSPPRDELVGTLCDLLDVVIALILDDDMLDRESRRRFFARLEVEESPALETLQGCMMRNVLEPGAALVARLTACAPDDESVRLRMVALLGQAMAFGCWGPACKLDLSRRERVGAIQTLLRQHVTAIFAAEEGARC